MTKPLTRAEKAYFGKVAEGGCLVCQRPAEIHHILASKARRWRRDNSMVVPLCESCHRGRYGVHGLGSEAAFKDHYGIDLIEEARKLWVLYGE